MSMGREDCATRLAMEKSIKWHSTVKGNKRNIFSEGVAYSQGLDEVKLHSFIEVPHTPTAFWDVLHSFENQSLWKYFHCDGNGEWINRGLIIESLVIVNDGSYMK